MRNKQLIEEARWLRTRLMGTVGGADPVTVADVLGDLANALEASERPTLAPEHREELADVITRHRFTERGLSGVPMEPDIAIARPLADAILARFTLSEQEEPEWEYAWEADPERRAQMNPRGPKYRIDGYPDTPENLARFPKGRRVRRRKAGTWEVVS